MISSQFCTRALFSPKRSQARSVRALHLSLISAFCAQGSCANYKLSGARGAQHQRLRGIKGLVGEDKRLSRWRGKGEGGIKALILLCLWRTSLPSDLLRLRKIREALKKLGPMEYFWSMGDKSFNSPLYLKDFSAGKCLQLLRKIILLLWKCDSNNWLLAG